MSVRVEHLVRNAPGSARRLLNDVSLDVPRGAFVALVGPSGAGKTTLLRAIAGLDNFEQGALLLDGQPMGSMRDRARKIGFVFQNYALFPHMTVAKNIAFGLDVLPRSERPSRSAIAARVQELLELMQLPDAGASYPARLSGGQRQRVALARALATGPGLLLLDEPFGALDPIVRRSIRSWLKDLHERLGLTTILVTHDQDEAVEIADRIVVMQEGQIVQDAPPEDLNRNPQTPFVMEFLGESSSFSGTVRDGLMVPDEAGILPFSVPDTVPPGPITAMARPYEIQVYTGADLLAAQATVSLVAEGVRNGYRHYRAQLLERSIPFCVPDYTEGRVKYQDSVMLNISRARLFRDGVLCV
ncbi:sulfate/molybdate ABC transporter ATP-binding protein [Acetobacter orleanensis]|uniref:Sulfate/thiosulfate import ATP-binding protein CysA n=1 Tax=Acetobacter orleanensis TaxID=104099 RepID=A0A4Y3TKW7_9PROT|nr:ATP-binding cassette domain-containing protein [Acetobacter orleanensis]KXV61976.1 sulfate ABC transporter ATP-binding protein [Acetobacter orleanensis]PCD80309.1 sulfate ABC transporter ATP-binding protein [Acetobacter orleanensis]GAN68945.1 ABC transporter sulfate permease cysA [Acetobacter orleanensis JCM 7639]GBR30649.1 nitrate/sulfonate/bicarbonate transporter ATP-binding protein [Acetobacter orleanensis NRIC 0473]GEB81647.1 sulfate/thiosulfate import ATP-binding protein CysA [Acetobac